MRKYIYAIGSFTLALAMGGVSVSDALAADNTSGDMSGGAMMNAQMQGPDASSTGMSVQMSAREQASGGQKKNQEHQSKATSSVSPRSENATFTARAREEVAQHAAEQAREHSNSPLFLELESTTTQAFSFAQLQQMIGTRRQELDQEEASTTSADQGIVKNANEVRLAVHALLAAKPLLGGIGQQVSHIAQQVDASVATTTNAEMAIQVRSFWTSLFFGGDSSAASTIKDAVAQNQQHIQDLTKLLNQANISVDVQTTLKAQIAAMKVQQTNLAALAQKEQSQWGLFSWRF